MTSPQTSSFGTHCEPFILPVAMVRVLVGQTKNHRISTQADDIVAATTTKVDARLVVTVSSEPAEGH